MPADAPTILATSGGITHARRRPWSVGPLTHRAVELSGVTDRAPRVTFLATATGDDARVIRDFHEMAQDVGWQASHLRLITMPSVDDVTAHLLEQDVVWVWGGSVAVLAAVWRLHGVDVAMRAAWEAGVVLTGVSAGSICWHVGGPTDSFGPDLQPFTDGLGLVPFSNGVHYDTEEQRRPLFQRLVADGTLPAGYATDDGVGVLYRGTEFAGAFSEQDGKGAYFVEPDGVGGAVETRLDTELLR